MSVTSPLPTSLSPRPRRLFSRSSKKVIPDTKAAPKTPSSTHLDNAPSESIQIPQTPKPRRKSRNAFIKALSKAIPCTSGKHHGSDDNPPRVVVASPDAALTILPPPNSLRLSPTSPRSIPPSCGLSFSKDHHQPLPEPARRPLSPPAPLLALDSPPPSSLSSIPLSLLGEEPCTHSEDKGVPPQSLFKIIDEVKDSLEKVRSVKPFAWNGPTSAKCAESLQEINFLFTALFGPLSTALNEEPVVEGIGDGDNAVSQSQSCEELSEKVSEDSPSVYSTTPPGSMDIEEETVTAANDGIRRVGGVPDIMLSLPTESDLSAKEEEEVPAPWLLNTQWMPTPDSVRKRRIRASIGRQIVRRMTSAPDLTFLGSAFDDDSESEDEQETPKPFFPESVTDEAEDAANNGLGISLLPSPLALAARRKKGTVHRVLVPDAVVDSPSSNATIAPVHEEVDVCETVFSPGMVVDNASVPVSASPPARVVSVISADADHLSATAQEDVAEPSPDHDVHSSVSRRIARRSAPIPYNRMSGVWGDRIVLKSDGSNFPTRDEALRAERRRSAAIIPGLLLPAKRGSIGYIKRPTGIRPLILPTRLALRNSAEHGASTSTDVSRVSSAYSDSLVSSLESPSIDDDAGTTGLALSSDAAGDIPATTPPVSHSPVNTLTPSRPYGYF